MNLGIFLSAGESLNGLNKSGQLDLFRNYYLKAFAAEFEQVYVFSYENESVLDLPKNVVLVPNKTIFHRYIYQFLIPFIFPKLIKNIDVFRAYHLSGTVPGIMTKIFFQKPFLFNYAYDYFQFSLIEKKYLQAAFFKFTEPLALKLSSKIFAANKTILQRTNSKKVVYLPNGVDTHFFKPQQTQNNQVKTILSVGRLTEQKNFKNLIEALVGTDLKLIIVGNGPLKDDLLQEAARYKVRLEFIDKIPHSQMPKIYNDVDLFVLPSLIEGHPKVLLEAMSCGLPVIASNVEGNREIVENEKSGIVSDTTVKSIKQSIEKLINDQPLRQKLSLNARLTVEKNFNLRNLLAIEVATIKSIK